MNLKITKRRLDIVLFEKGFAETRTKAQAIIIGRNAIVNNQVQFNPGFLVAENDLVEIKSKNPYVSRAGVKLKFALDTFGIDVRGVVCLDVGASTGGFTDCMLQCGAFKIYAVDVGSKQLHYKLRKDKRVVNIENVNFRYFDKSLLKDSINVVTIDVSFISLDKILPVVYESILKNGVVLAMVKPQFELEPYEVVKGVVRCESLRQKAINKIKKVATNLGFKIISEIASNLRGRKGNLEHFVLLEK
jgi:23S rRNA (cytidine1920-2'-O)/16S rRNA (cytidine1409-2'-O)-methyltransferase